MIFLTAGGDAKPSKLTLRGNATLPVPFNALSPDTDGVRVSLLGNLFGNIVDDRIPSSVVTGAWELASSGKKWTFKGVSDAGSSVYESSWLVQVTDRSNKGPNAVGVKVKQTGGFYHFMHENEAPSDIPPKVRIVFGSDADGSNGICGERAFAPDGCRTNFDASVDSFRCR